MRVKNWKKFQHFKDRTPPWIKLYRDILDDPDWHELPPKAAKILVMLWLIASEDDNKEGELPCIRKLSFRLRVKENELNEILQQLNGWLIHDDINMISEGYQHDAPETETETEERERQRQMCIARFDKFWEMYPNKKSKQKAFESWMKISPDENLYEFIIRGLKVAKQSVGWIKDGGQFVPHPSTWLNQKRWEDEFLGGISSDDDPLEGRIAI